MNLDLKSVLDERNRIINSFSVPIEHTSLVLTDADMEDHRTQLEEVYRKTLIHEASVFDDCCQRLRKVFRWN